MLTDWMTSFRRADAVISQVPEK